MSLDPERVGELAEALCRLEGHPRLEFVIQDQHYAAQALAPLIAGWLAEAEERGAAKVRFDRARHFGQGREAGAAEVRARVEALCAAKDRLADEYRRELGVVAARAIHVDDLRAALVTGREEQP